ncbi:hypothetical protein FALBO_1461 [Fusarium albosuccineum]|uniref:Peptidase A1 domain-containing protein n=1 Tax=Fusarium albosuccineum TaxID=1237068 RepID=A0A8H4PIG3_9HYPO|nr:hypothetical protein FALBO_1461 [Fusarium albosuccineum]
MWSAILGSTLLLAGAAQARSPAPVLLQPSAWQVLRCEPHCSAARGGIYEPEESTEWDSLGIWQLGLSYLGYGGNGEYGRDSLSTTSSNDQPYTMDRVLMAAINTTNYLNGLFGLGITQGNFNGTVVESPMTQAVKEFGWIPSYSFGYTAGAHYKNSPVSLTLGGVEKSRFRAHNNDFTLTQEDNMERPLVRGIEMRPVEDQDTSDDWTSQPTLLAAWNTSFEAVIDSTTPYLWLPDDVCDQFAAALNLTYNSTFDLYTITNDQYRAYSKQDTLSFTFVLSSFDNNDNFGDPYDVSGVVNITLPLRAFVSLLQYPFMQQTIQYGDPAIPYFMLRKAHNSTTYILGRSFLQESYLITKYDEGVFSIHQSLFPDDSSSDEEVTPINQPGNSPYPPPSASSARSGLSRPTVVGIGVGVGVFVACVVALIVWLIHRRKRKTSAASTSSSEDDKNSASDAAARPQRSPLMQLFSKITRRWTPSQLTNKGRQENKEISEAPNTQIHEMPAPVPPAELDGDDSTSLNGDTELGTDNSQSLSAYELARRKMERQLQGPVPAYTPPADGTVLPPEKAIYEPNPANGPPRSLQPSSTPSTGSPEGNSNPSLVPLPSPITPRFDASGNPINLPSPMTATIPVSPTNDEGLSLPSSDTQTNDSMAMGRSHSDREPTSTSNTSSDVPQPRTVQRTPIDPSKVVFLGPLPGNVRFSRHDTPRISLEQGHNAADDIPKGHSTCDSLGSNFTVEEERRVEEMARQMNPSTNGSSSDRISTTVEPDTPRSQERINPGTELVHVPQLAEKRYSWEEER